MRACGATLVLLGGCPSIVVPAQQVEPDASQGALPRSDVNTSTRGAFQCTVDTDCASGDWCRLGSCDTVTGACGFHTLTDACWVDSVCYPRDAPSPESPCAACNPDLTQSAFIKRCGAGPCDATSGKCLPNTECGNGVLEEGEECDTAAQLSDAQPDACRTDCRVARCGDWVVDSGESCDAGNPSRSADCTDDCRLATCGDGRLDDGEACDDGALNSDTKPNACRTSCVLAYCGDGVQDELELCDDMNLSNQDACLANCQPSSCGDGYLQTEVEECDAGPSNSDFVPNACRSGCKLASCGDGVADTGEACDDGNGSNLDSCTQGCIKASCGDGYVQLDEACDDGASNSNSTPNTCRINCQLPSCGDGVTDAGEACDDANLDPADSCDACQPHTCGDGVLQPGEACDEGPAQNSDTTPDACRTTCVEPSCGDLVVDSGETCDDGNSSSSDACIEGCKAAQCGDGQVWVEVEACDDGAANSDSVPDACRTSCHFAGCGDGVTDQAEACDDGNTSNFDACTNVCQPATCGDGYVQAPEACDAGAGNSNAQPNACRTSCEVASCGDGVVDGGEACDDGNPDETDGCTSLCALPSCGDGAVQAGEACDEGVQNSDLIPGACRTTCELAACGDGVTDPGEACDDGNADNTDACSTKCTSAACGDGYVQSAASGGTEECDKGSKNSDSGSCTLSCKTAKCGDGLVFGSNAGGSEECDKGTANSNSAACTTACKNAKCGDGYLFEGSEACDDGNADTHDACPACNHAYCGDSYLWIGHEACDPAESAASSNMCSATKCTIFHTEVDPLYDSSISFDATVHMTADSSGNLWIREQNSAGDRIHLSQDGSTSGPALKWSGTEQTHTTGGGGIYSLGTKVVWFGNALPDAKMFSMAADATYTVPKVAWEKSSTDTKPHGEAAILSWTQYLYVTDQGLIWWSPTTTINSQAKSVTAMATNAASKEAIWVEAGGALMAQGIAQTSTPVTLATIPGYASHLTVDERGVAYFPCRPLSYSYQSCQTGAILMKAPDSSEVRTFVEPIVQTLYSFEGGTKTSYQYVSALAYDAKNQRLVYYVPTAQQFFAVPLPAAPTK